MKKILITILCALSYQQATLTTTDTTTLTDTTTTIKLSTLTNSAGTPVVATCLLDNGASSGKIADINEEQLAKKITAGTKIPLYTKNDVPMGWGMFGISQGTALVVDGFPDPQACYILGNNVYNGAGTLLGEYYATLVTLNDATAAGASSAKDASGYALWLRITENGGAKNTSVASSFVLMVPTTILSADLVDINEASSYRAFTHPSLPDDYFLKVYIKPAATSTTA